MEIQPSLFKSVPQFPESRSLIEPDTRAKAHKKLDKAGLRVLVIKELYKRDWNADALAKCLRPNDELFFMSLRPRFTELKKAGLIYRTHIGLSNTGNHQDIFALFPVWKTRLATLAAEFGFDKAAQELYEYVKGIKESE